MKLSNNWKQTASLLGVGVVLALCISWANAADPCLKNHKRNMACNVTVVTCANGNPSLVCGLRTEQQVQTNDFDCWQPNSTTDRVSCIPKVNGAGVAVLGICTKTYNCHLVADVCVANVAAGSVNTSEAALYEDKDCPPPP